MGFADPPLCPPLRFPPSFEGVANVSDTPCGFVGGSALAFSVCARERGTIRSDIAAKASVSGAFLGGVITCMGASRNQNSVGLGPNSVNVYTRLNAESSLYWLPPSHKRRRITFWA